MRISFVILHFLTEKVTSSCIDALLSVCDGFDADIVVVDNASVNGSGRHLAGKYKGHKNIHFIFMSRNEGFARGNNAGYRYAKDNLNPDYIVVMNNDVMISDNAFIAKIEQEYTSSPFAVLGPDIFCPITGQHQNPVHLSGFTENELMDLYNKLASKLKHFYFRRFCWEVKLLLGISRHPKTDSSNNLYSTRHTNCVLHGACYIFSRDFISKRPCAFNPATFLYFEEDILQYECMRDNLKIRYTPSIQVVHLEDASTNKAMRIKIVREKVKTERILQSVEVMLNILHNDSKR